MTIATCFWTNAPSSPDPESPHLLSPRTGGRRGLRGPDVRVAGSPGPPRARHLPASLLPLLVGSTALQAVALPVGIPRRRSRHALPHLDPGAAPQDQPRTLCRQLRLVQLPRVDRRNVPAPACDLCHRALFSERGRIAGGGQMLRRALLDARAGFRAGHRLRSRPFPVALAAPADSLDRIVPHAAIRRGVDDLPPA